MVGWCSRVDRRQPGGQASWRQYETNNSRSNTNLLFTDINAGMHIDNDDVFLMGHSSGAHVIVEYFKHHCNKAKGQILFSPVDGFDPFGLVDLFAITPGEYLNYEVPTLVIMAGLDNQPGFNIGQLVPACAPDDLSNTRFYNAMPGNTWFVNATAYGHGDCLDEFYYDAMMVKLWFLIMGV